MRRDAAGAVNRDRVVRRDIAGAVNNLCQLIAEAEAFEDLLEEVRNACRRRGRLAYVVTAAALAVLEAAEAFECLLEEVGNACRRRGRLAYVVTAAALAVLEAAAEPAVTLALAVLEATDTLALAVLDDPRTLAAPVQSAYSTLASHEFAPALDPARFVIGTDAASMRPRMGRFRSTPHALLLAIERDDRHPRGRRWMAIDVAGASLWWRRGTTVAGLLVLVDLVGRVLGSCGGAR